MTAISAPRTNSIIEFAERTGVSYSAASRAMGADLLKKHHEALCLPMLGAIVFCLGAAIAFLL